MSNPTPAKITDERLATILMTNQVSSGYRAMEMTRDEAIALLSELAAHREAMCPPTAEELAAFDDSTFTDQTVEVERLTKDLAAAVAERDAARGALCEVKRRIYYPADDPRGVFTKDALYIDMVVSDALARDDATPDTFADAPAPVNVGDADDSREAAYEHDTMSFIGGNPSADDGPARNGADKP